MIRIFIASPTEALFLAQVLQSEILALARNHNLGGGDLIPLDVVVWAKAFAPGHDFLSDLLREANDCDFGVFVFQPIGEGLIRQQERRLTSANVIFEAGLFCSSIGPERTFLLVPQTSPRIELPSDLAGTTHIPFRDPGHHAAVSAIQAAIQGAALAVFQRIQDLGENKLKLITRRRKALVHILENGIDDVWERRKEAFDNILQDVSQARAEITVLARVYLSELLTSPDQFATALLDALEASRENELRLTFVATSPEDDESVERIWNLEDRSEIGKWGSSQRFRDDHLLQRVPAHYRQLFSTLSEEAAARKTRRRAALGKKLRVQHAYFSNFLTPYSMIKVDEDTLYVGFYSFLKVGQVGTASPTMKLSQQTNLQCSWFNRFAKELETYLEHHVATREPWIEFDV